MLLASWNLNSIRAREERLLAWLKRRQPDVVCLQELKCTQDQFPFEAIEAAGYQPIVHGQKTYNGVAILSKSGPTDVSTGFGDDGDESQARVIAATIDGVRIISVYVPNGGAVYSKKFSGPENEQRAKEKYAGKIEWLRRLKHFLEAQDLTAPLAICGDYNIIPGKRDTAYHEKQLVDSDKKIEHNKYWNGPIYNEELSDNFKRLLDLGLVDTLGEWRERVAVRLSDLGPNDERLVGCIKKDPAAIYKELLAADLEIGMRVIVTKTSADMVRVKARWRRDPERPFDRERDEIEWGNEQEVSRDVADNLILDDKNGLHSYSYWDYQWPPLRRNYGLRIDHILATPSLAGTKGKKVTEARVDKDERKEKKPSDHAPVFAEFHD